MTYKEAWEAIHFRHCEETCDYAYMDNCQEGKCEYYMALQALNRQYYAECGSVWTKPLADRKTEPQTEETEMERLERIDNEIEDAWARIRELTDEPKTCDTCKWGEWYRKGYDITMMDDECGGCCSWRSKWTPKDEQSGKE